MFAVKLICVIGLFSVLTNAKLFERDNHQCSKKLYVPVGEKCYKFHQSRTSWKRASQICEFEGGRLANVITDQDFNGLLNTINLNSVRAGSYWISGARVNNYWIWTADGSHMKEQWWGGSSNQIFTRNCAYFNSLSSKYWDGDCNSAKRFICELRNVDSFQFPNYELEMNEVK